VKIIERVRFGGRGQGSLVRYVRVRPWYSVYSVRGREIRESTGETDLRKARRFHRQRLDQAAADRQGRGKFLGPSEERVRVEGLFAELEADYRLRGVRAWAQFQAHLKPIREAFGDWRAVEVTAAAVDRYIGRRLESATVAGVVKPGKAPATVNRETQLLRQALRLAVSRNKLVTLPMIRHLPERNRRQGFFERPDFETVVALLPEYLRDFCRFGHFTGWRKGEMVSLTWSDVDRAAGVIRLRAEAAKNGQGRSVVVAGELAPLLERRWQARLVTAPDGTPRVTDLVFHRKGRPIGDIRKAWARACAEAGVAGRLFHDLRRTAVRNMVRAGVPERVAMEVSGHRTRSVFDRYNIVSEADLRAAMQKATDYVAAQPIERREP
jgi:integrase